ncbi:MAG: 3-dehydroquinate synthase [Anaeroplasmataceae bacterium]|nr:3-dehydroquinate synthase [Anaeroplasmataceae bacterium]
MRKLEIQLKRDSYEIIIENDLLLHLPFFIQKVYKNKKIYIITDDRVAEHYLKKVKEVLQENYLVDEIIILHGEGSKSIDVYCEVIKQLLNKNIRRNELLLALGGGVIGDLTGFIASTLYRGLSYVSIPTSLLSQMDSSIGGKTGIDFYGRKNIIGCFKQPKLVLIDPKTLKTLPKEEFSNGMGELIKHAVIGNPTLFQLLLSNPIVDENIIYESLSVKKHLVELDEFDQNERMLLNFGHTFGHVIELKNNLKHGHAVAIGMLMAIHFGMDLGITSTEVYSQVLRILELYQIPYQEFNYKEYLKEIIFDKKNLAGVIQFVLIKDIGQAFLYPIEEANLKELL